MKIRKAVIPAAGLGTRMLPATKTIPKEMLPIVDKPLIQYNIEEAVASGIEDILIVTARAKSAMDDYFDYFPELEERLVRSGREPEAESLRKTADMANIMYVRQKEIKGLGHAIWCARRFVGDEHFAILLGDDIMRSGVPVTRQLIDVAESGNESAVGVKRVDREALRKYCTLEVKSRGANVYDVSRLIEKPKPGEELSDFAILGRYVLSPEIFNILENIPAGHGGEIQLTDGINALCSRSSVAAVDFEGKRYDAGNLRGYLETVIDFALERPDLGEWLREFIKSK